MGGVVTRNGVCGLIFTVVAFAAGSLSCAPKLTVAPSSEATYYVFDAPGGERALVLQLDGDVVAVQDGNHNRLASLRSTADGIEVAGRNGDDRGRVVKLEGMDYRVLAASGATLFELSAEPDGDLRLRDGDARRIYHIKRRDYGYKLLDAKGEVEARVRSRDGKLSVRDADGVTFLSTRDPVPLKAMVALALDRIPLEYAAGLAVAIMRDAQEAS